MTIMRYAVFLIFINFTLGLHAQQDVKPATKASSDSVEDVQLENVPEKKVLLRKAESRAKGVPKYRQDNQLNTEISKNSALFKSKSYSSSNQRMQRSPSQEEQIEMDNIVSYFDSVAPNSFEYNYYKYVSSNYDVNLFPNLKEADKIRPNNVDVNIEMSGYYIIKGDKVNGLLNIEEVIGSGRLLNEVMLYSEDILLSAPVNSTLITHGFEDTYSTWYTQNKNNLRRDVRIVSLNFLQSEFYRNQLISEGYKMPGLDLIDVNFFSEFCKLNSAKNIVVSLTTPKEYFRINSDRFFITGVVANYALTGKFNVQENEILWRSILKKDLVDKALTNKGKQLSSNYLPMLLQIRKVYNSLSDHKMVTELDAAIDKISAQSGKYEKVQKLKDRY